MNNVLLIVDAFYTANFNVMLSVIKALDPDVIIHAVSMWGDAAPGNKDDSHIRYYSVRNSEMEFNNNIPKRMKSKASFYLNIFNTIKSSYFISKDTKRAFQKCEDIISDNGITRVFSVFHPKYAHEVAIMLCRKYPQIRNYQFWFDHFTNANYNFNTLFRKLIGKYYINRIKKIERHYFQAAERIYALPEAFIDDAVIEDFKDKLILFEIPYVEKFECTVLSKDITFAGSFDSRFRNPLPVFDVILESIPLIEKDIEFKFFVNQPSDYANFETISNGKMVFRGYLDRDGLKKQLSNSMMLMTIGNKGLTMMPSKTVEYVAYRKPILFFYADDNDASKRYLDFYPDVCDIDLRKDKSENSIKLATFINSNHSSIIYEDLMKVDVYRKSTPEHIREIISF